MNFNNLNNYNYFEFFSGNPLWCDCLRQWLPGKNDVLLDYNQTCRGPSELEGTAFNSLNASQCDASNGILQTNETIHRFEKNFLFFHLYNWQFSGSFLAQTQLCHHWYTLMRKVLCSGRKITHTKNLASGTRKLK